MIKSGQHICFVGSDSKKLIASKLMKQDLMSLVAGIKSIVFPNKKFWQGYAFIILHTEQALKELLAKKLAVLPVTKTEVFLRPNNPQKLVRKLQEKAKTKVPYFTMAILDGVGDKFSTNYFLKCAQIFSDFKFLGERKSPIFKDSR